MAVQPSIICVRFSGNVAHVFSCDKAQMCPSPNIVLALTAPNNASLDVQEHAQWGKEAAVRACRIWGSFEVSQKEVSQAFFFIKKSQMMSLRV